MIGSIPLVSDTETPSYSKVTIIIENDRETTTLTAEKAINPLIEHREHNEPARHGVYTFASEAMDVTLSFTALRKDPGSAMVLGRTVPK